MAEGPLDECQVFLAEHQFSPEDDEVLSQCIAKLGGTVCRERREANILLVNPDSPAHEKEKEDLVAKRLSAAKDELPIVLPYHWLAYCEDQNRLVSLEELPLTSPIFTHPDRSLDHRPLRAWVSINIHREEGETPEQAQKAVMVLLDQGGALLVEKRAKADILVVDEQSNFAKKVREEREKHGRTWQKIVEKDWVADCWRNKKLSWRGIGSKDSDDDHESMLGDDDHREGKAPGRPTGKPRIEYTPQDDDFLCRYLAAHTSGLAMSSRKTYQTLVTLSAQYPIAARHSAQSWLERAKKNQSAFSRRIQRFVQQDVDESLKTRDERVRAKADKAARALQAGREDASGVAGPSEPQAQAAAHPPAQPTISTAPVGAEAQTGSAAAPDPARTRKRKLVDSDDENTPPPSGPAASSSHSNIAERPETAPDLAEPLAPSVKVAVPGPSSSTAAETTAILPPTDQPIAQTLPSHALTIADPGDRTMDTDVVDGELLGLADGQEAPKGQDVVDAAERPVAGPANEDSESQDAGQTQAILADFARIRAAAATASASASGQAPSPQRRTVHVEEEAQGSRGAARSRTSEPAPSDRQATLRRTLLSPSEDRPRRSMPPTLALVDAAGGREQGGTRYETPSPAKALASRHLLLREQLLNSSQKRRRTLERQERRQSTQGHASGHGQGRGPVDSPDMVYQSTRFDSFAPRPRISQASSLQAQAGASPAASATSAQAPSRRRTPSPPLSQDERVQRVSHGAEIVTMIKNQYRQKISGLAQEFDRSPAEIIKWLNVHTAQLRGSGGQEEYWDNARRALRKESMR